jgi:Ser-tRNA(Ala) deacylase AlaX
MSVRKIFWENPYLFELDAVVTGVDGDTVTLDSTIAYAFSGGQQSDSGTIGGREILEARKDGLEILYRLGPGRALEKGERVAVRIDGEKRVRIMRLHFAAEIVLVLVNRRFADPEKIGANITAQKARIDFRLPGTMAEVLPEIAAETRRIVEADLAIVSAFEDRKDERRYWSIEGFARVPCGGTHPRRTGEVGGIVLKREHLGKGKERIEITLVNPG